MLGGYKFVYVVVSSTSSKKEKSKGDQEQENSNDLRDPALEQEERLLAVDEELLDDEDKEIMEIKKKEALVPQEHRETIDEGCTRKLISIDETSKLSFTLMCCSLTVKNDCVIVLIWLAIIHFKKIVGRASVWVRVVSGGSNT